MAVFPFSPTCASRCPALLVSVAICALPSAGRGSSELEEIFRNPPSVARPLCYWAWMNGNVSKEGITADLEAMVRVGVGGGMLFPALTVNTPRGPVVAFSDEWFGMLAHTGEEVRRLGLEMSIHTATGWSTSGGPWNDPADSMKLLALSEKVVEGPAELDAELPQPATRHGFYRDVAVFAIPAEAGEQARPKVRATEMQGDGAQATDGNWATEIALPKVKSGERIVVDLEYEEPIEAGTFFLVTGLGRNSHSGEISYSADGMEFKKLRDFRILEYGSNALEHLFPLPEKTRARFFRITFTRSPNPAKRISLAELGFHPDRRLDLIAAKAGYAMSPTGIQQSEDSTPSGLGKKDFVDLTAHFQDGRLRWSVPNGTWAIVRMGYSTTGSRNHPSPPEGMGLESDKMSRAATRKQWEQMTGRAVRASGPGGLQSGFTDSWESGYQNITEGFLDEFRKRRGYDPLPYLPVMTGRAVESAVISERFLADWRRTVADLFIESYFDEMRRLHETVGMGYSGEAYGSNFDHLRALGRKDMPMGEAWIGRPEAHRYTNKMAASAAQIYDRKLVGCEIFTCRDDYGKWMNHPFQLKTFGDLKWTEGINRFVIHASAHQPFMNLAPGIVTYGEAGIHFDRMNTWWEEGKGWMDYIRRAQALLQQGAFVGDVLFYTGEDSPNIPKLREAMNPVLPRGYDYTHVNWEALLENAKIEDGRLAFAQGNSYRYFVLADDGVLSVPVAKKLAEFVQAGGVLVGNRPRRAPGLTNYPKADQELATIADELWGKSPGGPGEKTVGKGRVVWSRTFEEIFAADKLAPDFSFEGEADLNYIHRRMGDAEFYFVAHGKEEPASAICRFRVSGKRPEFWHADTGLIEPAPIYREVDGITEVPISFDPAGSVFVVFRHAADENPIVSLEARSGKAGDFRIEGANDGKPQLLAFGPCEVAITRKSGETRAISAKAPPAPIEVTGPWQVKFQEGRGAPAEATFEELFPWNEHSEFGIKHFSGRGVYRTSFDVPKDFIAESGRVFLDLGRVAVIGLARLNGKDLGIMWKPPYRADVTEHLRPGSNELEVTAVNLWINRMIGDEFFPEDAEYTRHPVGFYVLKEWPAWAVEGKSRPQPERIVLSTFKVWGKDDKLWPSGLLGPVRLIPASTQSIL